MIAQPTLSKTQKYCLTFALALALSLAWTTLAHADGPGDLDITFGNMGVVTTTISNNSDGGFSVAIQPDNGKIVVAGIADSDVAVIRYNSDGSLDNSFNGTGVVTTSIGGGVIFGFATALQPDGKIIAAGNGNSDEGGFDLDFGVVRYRNDGSLDTDFNGTGIVTTHLDSTFDVGTSIALQPDGKIVVAGNIEAPSGMGRNLAVVRYTITGTLDIGFNGTGVLTTSLVSGALSGVAVQADGNIVVASHHLFRYTITGTLDTSFNGTGVVTTPGFSANSLKLQPDGKIVTVGSAGSISDRDFAVARYNSDGSLDTTFNRTGIVTTPITSENDGGLSVAIQLNGKIVVAGSSGDDATVIRAT